MWKKRLISLSVLVLALATAAAATGFALTGDGSGSPDRDPGGQVFDPPGNQPPIRSDEGIDPNKCDWVHNITACDKEGPADPFGNQPPVRSDDGIDPNKCNGVHNLKPCTPEELEELGIGPITGEITHGDPTYDEWLSDFGDGRVVTSIDPNVCNWVHNITACDNDGAPDQVADHPCCKRDVGPQDTEPGDKGGATDPREAGTPVHPVEVLEPDAGTTTPLPPDPVDPPDKDSRELEPAPDQDIDPHEYEEMLELVREDLRKLLPPDVETIELRYIERVTWGDTSLGNPQPTVLYAQVEVPGFMMVLMADGKFYLYHTSSSRSEVFSNQFVFVKGADYSALPVNTREKTSDEPVVCVEPRSGDKDVAPPPPGEVPSVTISSDGAREQALPTSYQSGGLHVDSTGQSPSSYLFAQEGMPLYFRLEAGQPPIPIMVDVRLYSGTGAVGWFFKWPEEQPTRIRAGAPVPAGSGAQLPLPPRGASRRVFSGTKGLLGGTYGSLLRHKS